MTSPKRKKSSRLRINSRSLNGSAVTDVTALSSPLIRTENWSSVAFKDVSKTDSLIVTSKDFSSAPVLPFKAVRAKASTVPVVSNSILL